VYNRALTVERPPAGALDQRRPWLAIC